MGQSRTLDAKKDIPAKAEMSFISNFSYFNLSFRLSHSQPFYFQILSFFLLPPFLIAKTTPGRQITGLEPLTEHHPKSSSKLSTFFSP
jgi:hypothetical protein